MTFIVSDRKASGVNHRINQGNMIPKAKEAIFIVNDVRNARLASDRRRDRKIGV